MPAEVKAESYPVRPYLPARPSDETELVQMEAPVARKLRNALLSVAGGVPLAETGVNREESHEKASRLESVYPVLLIGSLLLAAVFCVLYLTKPVVTKTVKVVEERPVSSNAIPDTEKHSQQSGLLPWPDGEPLAELSSSPYLTSSLDDFEMRSGEEKTNLKMQQIFVVEGLENQREKIEIEQVVNYPTRLLRWDSEAIRKARLLKQEMARHLNDVRIVKENGNHLMKQWEQLVLNSMPTDVLRADSPSLPENSYFGHSTRTIVTDLNNE